MPQTTSIPHKKLLDDLRSPDQGRQNHAFQALLQAANSHVDWAYDVWDDLLRTLVDGDNRQRSIAAQVLCNLAKSDPQQRINKDLVVLLKVTRDERFVTARHCLQAMWKIGIAGEPQRKALLKGLAARFKECATEKNCTLIRYDILVVLRRIFDLVNDEEIRSTAGGLMALEEDPKYRKKYATVWRVDKAGVLNSSDIASAKSQP